MWLAFANAKATHIFSAKILAYMPYFKYQSFNDTLISDIISFEQLGLEFQFLTICKQKKKNVVKQQIFMQNWFYFNSVFH